jgi:hypothetical protein
MDLHLRWIERPQTGVFKNIQSVEAKGTALGAPIPVPEHSLHEPHVGRPPSGHAVRIVIRVADSIGFDKSEKAVEIPDGRRGRDRVEHPGKRIDLNRQKERDLQASSALQYWGEA